jgi:membrane protein
MAADSGAERRRILRTLTFWLRPAFILRVVNRFQRVAGFDRAIALSSSAFTALIPLTILLGSIVPSTDAQSTANRIIARYGLTGAGAQAVRDVLSPAGGTDTSINIIGLFLLLLATLSFARGAQRLVEQVWELPPFSVRNTVSDLVWIVGLVCYVAFSWGVHDLLDESHIEVTANIVVMPATALLLAWGGRLLSARRLGWRQMLPFAIIGSVLIAVCLTLGAVYVPHMFSSFASRYGVIGAVLAMISALFALMVVIVASAALGREVSDDLDRIARGERPPEDEVRQEWQALVAEARLRTQSARERIDRLRHRDHRGRGP